ncbi:flagellar protein FliO/FliZ [Peptoclostridium litorale DSM 5388]|uniref:Flagellar protein n=1 Tax=Peptoclostridium litorale DSM 5388 TaxID=1121324 RepID=A0A069RG95_PEPLI|nr:flagellar biosynthetic protein FliO [Peptoclostridium litorale]KDR95175.1 hypothetical protein CLIT_11c02040 [Peptoclostridium litorale DSM 5388]SIN73809.1 flagellar protein FliO/FliZ [Peptoclostridium litorale DSM 5388]
MDIITGIIKILGYFAIFAIILFLAHYTSKFVAMKKIGAKSGGEITVKERVFLNKDKELVVVSLKDKEYLIGVSQSRFDVIDSFENKDDIDEKKI